MSEMTTSPAGAENVADPIVESVDPTDETPAPDVVEPAEDAPAPDHVEDDPAVVKARKEAANYRTRLRAAEATNTALRDQLIKIHLGAGGVTPAALEAAKIDLNTLVGEDGTISAEAVAQAAKTARETLGIPNNRFQGTADQGAGKRAAPVTKNPTWGNLLTQPGS